MTPGHYLTIRSLQEGRRINVDDRTRRVLLAAGFLAVNDRGVLVPTPAGVRRADAYQKRTTAARREVEELSEPVFVAHAGDLVNIESQCGACGAVLGSHMNRLPRPYPARGCVGFVRKGRAVA